MINPAELVDNLVAMLRDIPELVAEMEGDAGRIFAYHDQYPKRASLAAAIHDMPAPGIMAAWQGTQPSSFGGVDVWRHQVTLYLRARETFEGDPPTAYYRLFRLIVKGVPSTLGVPMLQATVHPHCYPMDVPSISRQTDAEGLDYFEVPIGFVEFGDE
ncbi:MAG: hypothetical protein KatS3mg004_1858 [Bryobacteraceae bacterium]|nr:MAG: hypothetical protein KatS3mg004_1858 [Bryobacteraceae bacterium]